MEMTEEDRMGTIEDKVMVCLCGLDNSPAGCDAITADPDLRRSSGRPGPRKRQRRRRGNIDIHIFVPQLTQDHSLLQN